MDILLSSQDRLEVSFDNNVKEISNINSKIEFMYMKGIATQDSIYPLLERIDKLEHENLCISEALQCY